MINCSFGLEGVELQCGTNSGGLITIALAPFDSVTGYTSTFDALGGMDYISVINTVSASTPFLTWSFNKDTANFVEEKTGEIGTGAINYQTTLTVKIPKRDKDKRNAIALASASYRDLLILVKDGNSLWNLMGVSRGANLITASSYSGVVPNDGSGWDITFVSNEPHQLPFVDATAVSAVIAS